MRFTNNLSRMARVLGATVLTAAAALTLGAAPAEAKPPPHAPAHGYRAKHRSHRYDHSRRYDRRYDHDRDRYSRYSSRYSRYRVRDRDYWRDLDGDGVRNSRDRYPRNPRRH